MRYYLFLFSLFCAFNTWAQENTAPLIYLQNASFEGSPQDATMPIAWMACEAFTTPDILPSTWGVTLEANDGETYIGLISREDGSKESITQRLSQAIPKGACYSFSVDLAKAASYSSYSGALKLRIWGTTDKCKKGQLLYESATIEHLYWKSYQCDFTAKQTIRYLMIEAFYKEGNFSHKGNILIDNISVIRPCPRA